MTNSNVGVPLVDRYRPSLSSSSSTSTSTSTPRHRRSRSVPDELHEDAQNMSPRSSHRSNSIVHIERRFNDQCSLQRVLEKALECNSSYTDGTPIPKPAAELIKEIALLEMEVVHLEQYLLSLYRAAFNHHQGALPSAVMDHGPGSLLHDTKLQTTDQKNSTVQSTQQCVHNGTSSVTNQTSSFEDFEKQRESEIQHVQNYGDQCSANSDHCIFPPRENHKSDGQKSESGLRSLADHLGASIAELIPMTPDRLSEEIIKCISSIYCKLAKPLLPQVQIGLSPSPASSLSSSSTFSPREPSDNWSPKCNDEITTNPCDHAGLKEKHAPYSEMVEIPTISVDDETFNYAASMLQSFRSLIQRLEKVDPRKMKHKEQLAFWINIHNALSMHASLAYGIHQNMKNASLTLKWLWTMFTPAMKYRTGNGRHAYAIDHPEPLAHFALCSGAYSDPAVRVYTAKRIFQELELAREEFIQVSVSIRKETKIILPKILYYYAKDASLDLCEIMEMVCDCMPEAQRAAIKSCLKGRPEKCIEWLSYNSSFRYLIHKELAKVRTSN
eukprot:TRINITY_DN6498_c0_g2_i5.p1 TRINITY_DN6498_c0_g2~~TRINITY_DN6498_c0_g2_i5.p1  ORF type:complete len:555 (-),score=119.44 TRINITY_DN6498_c0_g2_i5:347-2011(-)